MVGSSTLPTNFPTQAREFGELLSKRLVCGFRQIITRNNGEFYGYELLGRGTHPTLGSSPYEMFNLAKSLDMEVELSELLRERSFEQAEAAGITAPLFFNSHPKENHEPDRLLEGLSRLSKKHASLNLVFEVHEGAVTDLKMMADMKVALREMNIRLAYDDFGAGQARLLELAEVPPDILKFDIGLVAGIAPDTPKYRLLASLNNLVQEMGIPTLAEGIETAEVAESCREMGIDYFQGYFFGRPEPIPTS
nr:EAL domain-containing protein [Litorivivens lipolytica]